MNFVRAMFIFYTLYTGLLGLVINCLEPYIPANLSRLYRYGKYNVTTNSSLISKLEVPKRYFKHFYIFTIPLVSLEILLMLYIYAYGGHVPEVICQLLDFLIGASRKPSVSPEDTLLVGLLMGLHMCKRLYETTCVSIFSDKCINIGHYLAGLSHYFGICMCIIGESEGFVRGSSAVFSWNKITFSHVILAITFVGATYKQFRTNVILANLRKTRSGDINPNIYKVPQGELFDYVSAPLQLTEIILYITLSAILWKYSITYHYVTVWVIVNQLECALLTHWWYQTSFKNYPKTRKALIPYIY